MKITKKLIISNSDKIKLPYVLYIPENINEDANLIVEFSGNPPEEGRVNDIIKRMIDGAFSLGMDYTLHYMMENLSYPAIMPIIPRIDGFYSNYLGSRIINNDFSLVKNITMEEKEILSNIDEQVKEMIIEASNYFNITPKAIVKGYSAGAKFATQFSILHPEVVAFNISGGTSGLSTLPIPEYNGYTLPYPIGVANISNFNLEKFKEINHFFFIGSEDNNNPAMPACELSGEKDANGNPLPLLDDKGNIVLKLDSDGLVIPFYEDCYTKEEINIIHNLYGDDNLKRFKKNQEIYDKLGIKSKHIVYEGNHQSIFRNNRSTMCDNIVSYILENKKLNKNHYILHDIERER